MRGWLCGSLAKEAGEVGEDTREADKEDKTAQGENRGIAIHKIIKDFLAKGVAEFEVKREVRYLITRPKEIVGHT